MPDRNFDDLVDRFAQKIHGSAKGQIREALIQRHLDTCLPQLEQTRPLRVLDTGCGLGQSGLWLARRGHQVDFNDLSRQMLERTRQTLVSEGLEASSNILPGPLQQIAHEREEGYDLVLCHAVLEWLAEPHSAIRPLARLLKPGGHLSLAFYNRDALIFRNLIRGNWRQAESGQFSGYPGGFTPQNPLTLQQIETWLAEERLSAQSRAGLRVIHDYLPQDMRQQRPLDELIRIEWKYARHPAYLQLGRYVHVIAVTVC